MNNSKNTNVRIEIMKNYYRCHFLLFVLLIFTYAEKTSCQTSPLIMNMTVLCKRPQNPAQTPDPFDFKDRFDVSRNTEIISEPVTITGITEETSVSISEGAYAINDGNFTSVSSIVNDQDQIKIRLAAAAGYGQVTTSKITVGDVSAHFSVRTEDDPDRGWTEVPEILSRIQRPVFPNRDFNITAFGAVVDGLTDCTNAFRQAISACHDSGGGRVVVPDGIFLTGPIHLKSNVNLYLSKNALVKFSQDPTDYLPVVFTRFEGTECYNYSPPVYAFEQENIAITGQGILDGQGDSEHWWPWKSMGGPDVSQLRQQAENGVPVSERVYGDGHYLRPNMIQPYRCKNVVIDSVTVLNGPMWHIHPVLCENVSITNVGIVGHGPNNDGCNPESCQDVLIKGCYFNTGDDCIAIKSGRNADGRRINTPTENVIIQNCTMKDGHGGVVIGSEISGSARNIFAEDCYMDSPNLDRALRIKTNSIRGGIVENVFLRNITVGVIADAAIRVNFYYGEGDISDFTPIVRNVEVRNMTCERSNYALRLAGYARSPISNVRLISCTFNNAQKNNSINHIQNLILNQVFINDQGYDKILEPNEDQTVAIEQASIRVFLPETIQLLQNHPNPFNAVTTIPYHVGKPGNIKINIFNIFGQLITTLVNASHKSGTYKVNWDGKNRFGRNVPSGVYFYNMESKEHSQAKKLLIIN